MKVLAFPSALHICPACNSELATGMDSFGKPRRCYDCQAELMQFVGSANRLRILPTTSSAGFVAGNAIGGLDIADTATHGRDKAARTQQIQFKAATVGICLVAFGVLSAIGWMLR